MQDINTRLLSANLDFTVDFNTSLAVYLTYVPTLENSALILFFLRFGRRWLGWRRTFHVVDSFDENTHFPD